MHQHSSPNAETKQEKVLFVPLTSIDDFPDHPFQVKDDEEMQKLMTSIQIEGVLSPLIVRQKENGRYELISGHRRKYACQSLNLEQVPVIVRDFSREEAVIAMVDSKSRVWLGKYAELRREYLIKHRRGTYGVLLGEGKLPEHLEKIEEEAQEMLANILSRAVKEQWITEKLKARDPLLWVQKMKKILSLTILLIPWSC